MNERHYDDNNRRRVYSDRGIQIYSQTSRAEFSYGGPVGENSRNTRTNTRRPGNRILINAATAPSRRRRVKEPRKARLVELSLMSYIIVLFFRFDSSRNGKQFSFYRHRSTNNRKTIGVQVVWPGGQLRSRGAVRVVRSPNRNLTRFATAICSSRDSHAGYEFGFVFVSCTDGQYRFVRFIYV